MFNLYPFICSGFGGNYILSLINLHLSFGECVTAQVSLPIILAMLFVEGQKENREKFGEAGLQLTACTANCFNCEVYFNLWKYPI
tara:strand:- start:1010 stop:1264 length:255 start_codon:yes stop_codon:yes gene_type:complete